MKTGSTRKAGKRPRKSRRAGAFFARVCASLPAILAFLLRALWGIFKFLVKLSRKYKFGAAIVLAAVALLIVAHCRKPRGYVKTPEETAYIERLRKKYAVAERKLGVEAALKIIRSACGFITRADNAPKGFYDSEEAELLLLGTALVESDLAPRFQQSRGDAIGLFQIEYGTFRDLWDRSIKYKHPKLYSAIIREFGGSKASIDFEDLQKNDVLCAIFARMKYAEFPDKIPSDAKGRAAYYKKFFNTQYGASKESVYISKKEKALSSSKNKKLFQNWKLNSKK